jgi:hypothetical protein
MNVEGLPSCRSRQGRNCEKAMCWFGFLLSLTWCSVAGCLLGTAIGMALLLPSLGIAVLAGLALGPVIAAPLNFLFLPLACLYLRGRPYNPNLLPIVGVLGGLVSPFLAEVILRWIGPPVYSAPSPFLNEMNYVLAPVAMVAGFCCALMFQPMVQRLATSDVREGAAATSGGHSSRPVE